MRGARTATKRLTIGLMAMVQLLFFPVVTFAESPSPASIDQAAVTGAPTPTGADAKTYTYNEATGLWENNYYTWDPKTKQTSPKDAPAYSYNPETDTWDTTEYVYSAPIGAYIPQSVPAEKPTGTLSPVRNEPKSTEAASGAASLPQDSHNSLHETAIDNSINSYAQSGNSSVLHNTNAAGATSGNALAIANVLNILQSSWGMSPDQITTFMADINGDVMGDLLLDPNLFNTNDLAVGVADTSDITVNNSTNSSINNNVSVVAKSGNAQVAGNTTAGDAVSGPATAIANIINLINTHISTGQSFIGNININGNLEGDILLPSSLQNELLASNVPTATISHTAIDNGSVLAEFAGKQDITNILDLDAQSGAAGVSNNTTAGSALTGSSSTELTLFNLTGRQVVGSNALLVFVNVLGEWVGMIVDAPTGATSALIGNNIEENTQAPIAANLAMNIGNTQSITNNVSAVAHSGSANVTANTTGGSATSGNAKAGASIANISNSQFSLADWFGVLFINVLGNWHGSFGIDTPMGDTPITPSVNVPNPISDVKIFEMAQGANGVTTIKPSSMNEKYREITASSDASSNNDSTNDNERSQEPAVLGSTDNNGEGGAKTTGNSVQLWPAVISLLVGLILLAAARILQRRARIAPTSIANRRHSRLVTIRPAIL